MNTIDTTGPTDTPPGGDFANLIDQQLELAAARLPALDAAAVHPAPEDHDELIAEHPSLEDVLLGKAQPTPQMLEELAALDAAPPLSDEELARQALADGGGDGDVSTPE
jgi:hypothetical protein